MPSRRVATSVVFVAISLFTLNVRGTADDVPSPRVKKFLGDAATDVLLHATRVEAFRLKDKRADEDDGKPTLGKFEIAGAGKEQGEAFAKRLAAVLLDERTYDFESAKRSKVEPDVGFRVWKGDEAAVEVVVCFGSDELIVHSPKSADGSVRGAFEDFDRARPSIVRLAKEAFPDDKQIQILSETK